MTPVNVSLVRGPRAAPAACTACPLAKNGIADKAVLGVGPRKPLFIILGEGAGANEVRVGQPFVGASGQLVNRALKTIGVERGEVWISNVTLCAPYHAVGDKDKAVAKASECCRVRLDQELKAFPKVPIIALGAHAAKAFLGSEFKITELAGSYHEVGGRAVIPTIHPAAILRGGGGEGDGGAHAQDLIYWNFLYDMGKVAKLARGEIAPFTEDVLTEHEDMRRAEKLIFGICNDARKAGWVALDTETVGVAPEDCKECWKCKGHEATEPRHAQLTAVGIATEKRAVSVAWEVFTPAAERALKGLLGNPRVGKVFHNRGYDEVVFARHDMPVKGRIDCTMYLHHNVFPGLAHKLQRVATQFLLVKPWKSEFRHGEGEIKELLKYNALDTLCTARIKPKLEIGIKKYGADKTYEIDLKKAEIAARMQDWGVPIDLDVNAGLADRFAPIIRQIHTALKGRLKDSTFKRRVFEALATEQAKRVRKGDSAEFDIRYAERLETVGTEFEFNLNARDQVVALLKASGAMLNLITAKGKLSTNKDVLESLSTSNEVAKAILRHREYDKIYNTFLLPIPHQVDHNSIAHPEWSPNKITGRFGSSPNYQNVSKGDSDAKTFEEWCEIYDTKGPEAAKMPNLRWQVVAPPGRIFVGADQSQLEARIVALLSGDKYLVDAFTNDVDIHSEFCKVVFPEFAELAKKVSKEEFERTAKKENPWKQKRDIMKRAEYGYLYGAAIPTVHKSITKEGFDVSLKTIMHMFKVFKERMPGVAMFHASLFRDVMTKGEIKSFLYGRRRAFPLGNAEDTVVKNFTVQSGAADIVDTALVRLYEGLGPKDYIILQGHDAITVETDEDRADTVKELLTDCMTQEHTVRGVKMLFPCEVDAGKTWAAV